MTKASSRASVRWIHEERDGDAVLFRAGTHGTDMVAEWPGLARLRCSRDGSDATFTPVPGASRRELGKLRRGQVSALLRDLAGQLALHASAVGVEGRAVMFLGSDGAGKSTAAAEMCFRHDAHLFADDAASLDVDPSGAYVLPSEMDHWLTGDSCRAFGIASRRGARIDKQDLRASRLGREPSRLALVVSLRVDPTVTDAIVRPLRGSEAGRLLLEAAIRFDVDDATARRREFEQLTAVYDSTTFVEFLRPPATPCLVAPFVLAALERVDR